MLATNSICLLVAMTHATFMSGLVKDSKPNSVEFGIIGGLAERQYQELLAEGAAVKRRTVEIEKIQREVQALVDRLEKEERERKR